MNLISTRSRSARSEEWGDGSGDVAVAEGFAMRLRVLMLAAFGPLVTGYAAVAAVFALVSSIASHAQFAPLDTLLAAGPGLLAVYQVPVEIGQSPLGVLPLLPTIGVCALVTRTAGSAAQRLGYREPGQAVPVVAAISGGHAVVAASIALLSTGEPFRAEPLSALLITGLVSGASALLGVSGRCGISSAMRRWLNEIALAGLRAGALAMAALFAVGSVTFAIGMFSSVPRLHDLFVSGAAGSGGGFGLLLLSLGYLPNAVLAGTAVATGAGVSIGGLSISPLAYTAGPLPGIPVLAAAPESYAGWWPLLLLLPAFAGCLVGWYLRSVAEQPLARLRAVAVAGVLAALGALIVAPLAGGRLGEGVLHSVEIPAGMLSVAVFCWIVVPAGIVSWFAGPRPVARFGKPDSGEVDLTEDEFEEDFEDDLPDEFEEEFEDEVDHDPEDEDEEFGVDEHDLDEDEFEVVEELDEVDEVPGAEESHRGPH